MIVVDVNLLLYAVLTGAPAHESARTWWEGVLSVGQPVALPGPTIFGFLRLVTSPRVTTAPMTVGAAVAIVEEWLALPHVTYLTPGPRHLELTFDLLRGAGMAGNLTTDGQLAAYALEYDAELYSADSDFARFPAVRWVNPLLEQRH